MWKNLLRQLLGVVLATSLLLSPVSAAESKPPAPALAAATNSRPLLWKIEGHGYLFGTIHLTDPAVATIPDAAKKAIEQSDAVFCEIKMDSPTLLKAALLMQSDKETLTEILPKDLLALAQSELERISPALRVESFEQMRVWAFAALFTQLEDSLKNPGALPLDMKIFSLGEELKKQTGGIETVEEQVGTFEKLTRAEQILFLRSSLNTLVETRKQGRSPVREMREAYLTGELDRLHKFVNEWSESADLAEKKLNDKLLDILLWQRNKLMAQRIAARLRAALDKKFFFAVGAAHLYSDSGLIRLLEKSGFKITRDGQ